jgi:hypothetical protein
MVPYKEQVQENNPYYVVMNIHVQPLHRSMHPEHSTMRYLVAMKRRYDIFQEKIFNYLPVALISTLLPLANFSNKRRRLTSKSIENKRIFMKN